MLDHIDVNTAIVRVEDFYNIGNFGIGCTPCCSGCKWGKCSLGTQNFTIKEEKELHLIKSKLEYNREEKRWIAEYSWIQNPAELPDNKMAAMGMLISTEKRLAKKGRTRQSLLKTNRRYDRTRSHMKALSNRTGKLQRTNSLHFSSWGFETRFHINSSKDRV